MNPGRGFYGRELSRLVGRNINAVRRELTNLEAIGLLDSKSTGNTRTYTVNMRMSIHQELTSIILKTEGVGETLRERIDKIGGIENAFIYGSFAQHKAGLDSDVDLFIIGTIDEDELGKAVMEIERRVSRNVNYVAFTREEYDERRGRGDPFVSNVLSNPRIDLIGTLP